MNLGGLDLAKALHLLLFAELLIALAPFLVTFLLNCAAQCSAVLLVDFICQEGSTKWQKKHYHCTATL